MSKINDGGAAFPCHSDQSWAEGMALRDYFAAKAMQAVMCGDLLDRAACESEADKERLSETVARYAYKFADAMLAERDKGCEA